MNEMVNTRTDSSTITCPTCGIGFRMEETKSPPFCSERCQLIDLGRWLGEEIGMPHEGGPDETQIDSGKDDDEIDLLR